MKRFVSVSLLFALVPAMLAVEPPAPEIGPDPAKGKLFCISRKSYNMIDFPITCSHQDSFQDKKIQFVATIRELRRSGWNLTPEINGFDSQHELFTFVYQE